MHRVHTVGLLAMALLFGGCADPHYNLDVRNMSSELVDLQLVASNNKDEGEPRVITRGRVGPGSSTSMFAEGKRGDKARLEARVDGDTQSEPARLDLTSGLSSVDVMPAQGDSKSRLRLREVVRQ
jgi:hypothetical protein